jgi:mannobiose 2-epimerase
MESDFMASKVSFFDRMRRWRRSFSRGKPVCEPRSLPCYRPDDRERRESREDLERILTQNIIPFWYPETVDSADGGYRLNHDLYGKWMGPADKDLITQARTVWFFSRLSRTRYGTTEHLDAARHGYTFLRERMWDKEWGGTGKLNPREKGNKAG